MSDQYDYSKSCDYIRERFGLGVGSSIYTVLNTVTNAYKELVDKQILKEGEGTCQTVRSLKKTKVAKNLSSK